MGLTDLLDQIDRLDQEATKGPWEKLGSTVESNGTYEDVITTEVDCSSYCYGGRGGGVLKDKDAEFIALARTALPQLAKALQTVLTKCASMERGVGYRVSGKHDTWDSYHEGMSDMAGYIEEAITDTLGADHD